jgi:hypothetical protein
MLKRGYRNGWSRIRMVFIPAGISLAANYLAFRDLSLHGNGHRFHE